VLPVVAVGIDHHVLKPGELGGLVKLLGEPAAWSSG